MNHRGCGGRSISAPLSTTSPPLGQTKPDRIDTTRRAAFYRARLPVRPCVHPSICPSVHLSVRLSIRPPHTNTLLPPDPTLQHRQPIPVLSPALSPLSTSHQPPSQPPKCKRDQTKDYNKKTTAPYKGHTNAWTQQQPNTIHPSVRLFPSTPAQKKNATKYVFARSLNSL